jgi:hypothetical protein
VSRLVWFAAGAGAGVYAVARARRVAQALTPEGIADRLSGLSVGLHLFRDEVRAGMTERERDLRGRLALAPPAPAAELPATDTHAGAVADTAGNAAAGPGGTRSAGTPSTGTAGTGTASTGTGQQTGGPSTSTTTRTTTEEESNH